MSPQEHEIDRPMTEKPYSDADVLDLQDAIADARIRGIGNGTYSMARAVLDALAAAGRLLPPDTDTRTEWGVWWHSGDSNGIVLSEYKLGFREDAERRAEERIGDYGITRYTLLRCSHRKFADGSTLVGPWVPVPTTPDAGDPS